MRRPIVEGPHKLCHGHYNPHHEFVSVEKGMGDTNGKGIPDEENCVFNGFIKGYEEALIADCSFAVLFSILDCVLLVFLKPILIPAILIVSCYPDSILTGPGSSGQQGG